MHHPEDVGSRIEKLQGMDLNFTSWEFSCERDNETGLWDHDFACPTGAEDYFECDYKISFEAARELARLKRRPLLKIFLQHPELALMNMALDDHKLLFRDW